MAEKDQLQNKIYALQHSVSTLESRISAMGPSFTGNYNYNQYEAADLSRIISRYLFNKLDLINSNHMFNCVKTCYNAAFRDDSFKTDTNMLLAVCNASNWFSYNQQCKILAWHRSIEV